MKFPFIVLVVFLIYAPFNIVGNERSISGERSIRKASLGFMGEIMAILGSLAYCDKYIEKNKALMDAAANYNKRHHMLSKKIVEIIKATGGISNSEKEKFNKKSFKVLKVYIESMPDKKDYCSDLVEIINSKKMDFLEREDTKQTAIRILDYKIENQGAAK